MSKKNWITPMMETLEVSATEYTYLQGTNPDGAFVEDGCEYTDPAYAS